MAANSILAGAASGADATGAAPPADNQISFGQYAEKLGLRLAIVVGLLVGVLVIAFNWDRNPVPMLQDRRGFGVLALYVAPLAIAIAAGIGYTMGVRAFNARTPAEFHRKWAVGLAPVGLAYGVVAALLIVVILELVDAAFHDLELVLLQAVAIAVLVGGALANWAAKRAIRSDSGRLLELAIIIIAGGVYLTATQVENPAWWRISFSYLGSLKSSANIIFNVTLVFGALLLIAWIPYFLTDLRVLIRHGTARPSALTWIRLGVWWVAVGIALVGIFKTQSTPVAHIIHNVAAYSLAGMLGLLMLGAQWLVPGAPKEVLTLTWMLVAALAVTLIMAALMYINTVGLEVIAFSLGIMWLQTLVRSVATIAAEQEPAGYPR